MDEIFLPSHVTANWGKVRPRLGVCFPKTIRPEHPLMPRAEARHLVLRGAGSGRAVRDGWKRRRQQASGVHAQRAAA
jgi:hypothetical protein